jgi:hypothetical protein
MTRKQHIFTSAILWATCRLALAQVGKVLTTCTIVLPSLWVTSGEAPARERFANAQL